MAITIKNACSEFTKYFSAAAAKGIAYINSEETRYNEVVAPIVRDHFGKKSETAEKMLALGTALSQPVSDIKQMVKDGKFASVDELKKAVSQEEERINKILMALNNNLKSASGVLKIWLGGEGLFSAWSGAFFGYGTKALWQKMITDTKGALAKFKSNGSKRESEVESQTESMKTPLGSPAAAAALDGFAPPPPPPMLLPSQTKQMSAIQKLFQDAEQDDADVSKIKQTIEQEAEKLVPTLFDFTEKGSKKINIAWMERFAKKYFPNEPKQNYPTRENVRYVFIREPVTFKKGILIPYEEWHKHVTDPKFKSDLKNFRQLNLAGSSMSTSDSFAKGIATEKESRHAVINKINDAIKLGNDKLKQLGKTKKKAPAKQKELVVPDFLREASLEKWQSNFKTFYQAETNKIKNIESVQEAQVTLEASQKQLAGLGGKEKSNKEQFIAKLEKYIIDSIKQIKNQIPLLITATQPKITKDNIESFVKQVKTIMDLITKLTLLSRSPTGYVDIANKLLAIKVDPFVIKDILTKETANVVLLKPVL